jgi:hypothetical protein
MLHRWISAVCAMSATAMSSVAAAEPFIGRWAMKPEVCNAFSGDKPLTTPLVATDSSITWFDGYCRIGKIPRSHGSTAIAASARCIRPATPFTFKCIVPRRVMYP